MAKTVKNSSSELISISHASVVSFKVRVMGCQSHHAMLDPYCGGTACTRAAGSILLRAKLTRGELEWVLGCCSVEVEDLFFGSQFWWRLGLAEVFCLWGAVLRLGKSRNTIWNLSLSCQGQRTTGIHTRKSWKSWQGFWINRFYNCSV